MAYDMLARLGAGVTPNQMHAERVDGYNPLAVIDAVRRKKELLLKGEGTGAAGRGDVPLRGPFAVGRLELPHQGRDGCLAGGRSADNLPPQLIEAGVATEAECDAIKAGRGRRDNRNLKLAIDDAVSPRMDLNVDPDMISRMMYTNKHVERYSDAPVETLMPMADNPRVKAIAGKERFYMKDGKPVSKNKVYQFRDALFEAIIHRFYIDPTLVGLRPRSAATGAAHTRLYRGLTEALPYHRCSTRRYPRAR